MARDAESSWDGESVSVEQSLCAPSASFLIHPGSHSVDYISHGASGKSGSISARTTTFEGLFSRTGPRKTMAWGTSERAAFPVYSSVFYATSQEFYSLSPELMPDPACASTVVYPGSTLRHRGCQGNGLLSVLHSGHPLPTHVHQGQLRSSKI